MVRKKIDNRIRVLIENCVSSHYRSLFIVVGERGRDNIVTLHEMLSKAEVKARPTVLWCYKKDLGFSTHKKKRQRLKKARTIEGKQRFDEDDSLEYFIASTNIRYCYYSESHSILGQTFGMAILQDFEALTPNLLARTIETVEGGGMIVILLQTLTSLKQLYTMTMDVHARYRTEAHQTIVCRFNERFILSLPTCADCLVLDDKLNILPISSNALNMKPLPPKTSDTRRIPEDEELYELKASLDNHPQPTNALIKLCKTLDQAKAVMKFIDSLAEKTLRSTVTLTSARGRGKSAALGLAIAAALVFNYTNIFVTSPHPENLKTFFEFLLEGLKALGFEKTTDFCEIRSNEPEFNKAIIQVNITRSSHRQSVKYIHPSTSLKVGLAELIVIDEAAAIPLPFVKSLLGPYLVFMASTINGYEGTGRSLSLKLINQLREESKKYPDGENRRSLGRVLHEISLNQSIRYANGDKVEDWLNRLLCLDVKIPPVVLSPAPDPNQCKLYYVNRDTLFSYNKFAEKFLRKLVSIFIASHYKNSPNDLLIMSDAPAHHIFCLCAPSEKKIPHILCVVQVCLEGKLSQNTVKQELSRGRRGAGDLIPWTISQEFSEDDFPALSGARIVRIATHPDYIRKGYGFQTLKLLQEFYEGKFMSENNVSAEMTPFIVDNVSEDEMEETLKPRTSLPPLLFELHQINPDILDYLGVSYGVSEELLRFWKKAEFCPLYLAHSPNQLTGEHSCIMLKQLHGLSTSSNWLPALWYDFCEKIVLSLPFAKLSPQLILELISSELKLENPNKELTKEEILCHLMVEDLNVPMVEDDNDEYCPPNYFTFTFAQFFFMHRIQNCSLTSLEKIIMLSVGLLHTSFSECAEQLNLAKGNVKKLFLSGWKKIHNTLSEKFS